MPINDNVLGNLINNFTIPVLRSKTSEVEVLFFASRGTRGLVLKKKRKRKRKTERDGTVQQYEAGSSIVQLHIRELITGKNQ